MSDLKLINVNLGGDACAALIATILANGGNISITRADYEKLPAFYRLEMYADSENSKESTYYEVRIVGKEKLDEGDKVEGKDGDASSADVPEDLQNLLKSLGIDITRH